jgi:hypothetical protein
MSYSVRAKLAFGIDLGTTQPFFTDGRDGGVYAWAEGKAQKEIMEPISYNETSIFLAVKGRVIDADASKSPANVDLVQLIATADQRKVEAFKAHLLAAGFDEIEPRWRLIAQVS